MLWDAFSYLSAQPDSAYPEAPLRGSHPSAELRAPRFAISLVFGAADKHLPWQHEKGGTLQLDTRLLLRSHLWYP